MTSSETNEHLADPARSAFEMMARLDIPAEPNNYEIWYAYHAGSNPELNLALDALLDEQVQFTPERNQEIHARFFGFERMESDLVEISQSSRRIEAAVTGVLEQIADAGSSHRAYGKKLATFSGKLDLDTPRQDVAALIQAVRSESQNMLRKTRDLEVRLGESSKEINQLRRRLEEARLEAMTDALTGIGNRKYFDATLQSETEEARESGAPVSILLADIDHFKAFNDTHGHKVGDEVLKVVARTLDQSVKGRDTPARYGGEEFAVILPRTALADAVTLAEQIRQTLASRDLKGRNNGQGYGTVTLSIGVAQYRTGERIDDLVKRADEALYMAKAMSRNCVVAESGAGGT